MAEYEIEITAYIEAEDDAEAFMKYVDGEYNIDDHRIFRITKDDDRLEVDETPFIFKEDN